jgi:hypothetical protein
MLKSTIIMICAAACLVWADADFAAMANNSWQQLACTGEGPRSGGDVHWAVDTSGYAYMFGGCTYGNGAGGSHNNDIYRYNLKTGYVDHLASCSNNTWSWRGGCQASHAYDITRNAVWFAGGAAATCGSGQNGVWRYQCPDGPAVRVGSGGGNGYMEYDPVKDMLYAPGPYALKRYDCSTNTWLSDSPYPFYTGGSVDGWAQPCCFDTKRRLWVMTLLNTAYSTERTDMYFYHADSGTWHTKVPAVKPGFKQAELGYDELNDRYVYFGVGPDGCTAEVWVYEYDINTWTQMPTDGKAYNDTDKPSSTWPPGRHKHTWSYCSKYNVFATWGGGQWINDLSCTDYGDGAQPIWFYRLNDGSGTDVKKKAVAVSEMSITASPNPFASAVTISVKTLHLQEQGRQNGKCNVSTVSVYDIHGRTVYHANDLKTDATTWSAAGLSPGLYIVRARIGSRTLQKKITLLK